MTATAIQTLSAREQRAMDAFRAFVDDPAFPCLGGKGVIHRDGARLHVYGMLGSNRSTRKLGDDLLEFLSEVPADGSGLHSFIAVFPQNAARDELEFEQQLWEQLRRLHEYDEHAMEWDPTVSKDPEAPDFSYSFGGRAMFVIGLHPASSRLARRFRWPTLVFNPHAQFEHLRADGRFEHLQAAVRAREIALQGSLNPNLANFGEQSEARQYSGRAVEAEWRCPFHARSE